jgi:ectoine hydroxylase-related dioxygenase (phytanoyl-CoA dioxygenase family)
MWKHEIDNCGFAVIPGVLDARETESFLAALRDTALSRSKAGIRHLLGHQATAAIAHDPRLMAVACDVLGPKATPFHATLFDKSPDANWLVVWHQDTALPLREKRESFGWGPWSVKQGVIYAHAPATALQKVLALRIHLDDSTMANGPLRVLPGTHERGVLSDDSIQESVSRIPAIDCPVAKGGILIMRPLIVHSSSKSQTEMPRRVLHIEYASSTEIAEGMELAQA